MSQDSQHTRRRSFSYSLRALLVFVTLLAATLALCVRDAHRQRTAVDVIRRSGGSVVYDYVQHPDRPLGTTRFGRAPKPIIDLFGEDFFAAVISIRVPQSTDEIMVHVGNLRSLQYFDGNNHQMSQVTDAGVAELAKLKSLNHIILSSDQITDESLRIFGNMSQLQEGLELRGKQITDAGIAHLSAQRQLIVLRLSNSQVSDHGLAALAGYEKLWALDLDGTRVTGPGLLHLTGISSLEHLDLGRTPVDDAGLEVVARLAKLRHIRLNGTNVTSSGLAHLHALKALESIDLSDTKITDDAWPHLARVSALQEILVQRTQVTGQGIEQLNRIVTLRGVWLDGTGVTDDALDTLDIGRFRYLGLLRTNVSDRWVSQHGGARVQDSQPYIDH